MENGKEEVISGKENWGVICRNTLGDAESVFKALTLGA
jgi:hypothetical protein